MLKNNKLSVFNNNIYNKIGNYAFSTNLVKNDPSKLYAPTLIREVEAPVGGGPLYWSLRRYILNFKRGILLSTRTRRWNWDIVRAAFAGCPKVSYDPKINQWITLMDNEEWGGIGGRFWIQFSNVVLFNFLLAFLLYFSCYRLVVNNKHNVFARWAKTEEDED